MADIADAENKFWKALKSDRTVMLGLEREDDGQTRPMTALVEEKHSPIWFFSSKDAVIVQRLDGTKRAVAAFSSKGHDLFASIRGSVVIDTNRAVVERLWNPYVAAWYEGGKDDPKLVLLRFDAETAEVWFDASSVMAGLKMLLGADPKKEYRDKVAEISLT